mgnify:CR=1 FL=1
MQKIDKESCPTCGKPGQDVGLSDVTIRQEDGSSKKLTNTPLFRCISGCTQDTSYGGEWEKEWVIDGDQKVSVQPSASEFA